VSECSICNDRLLDHLTDELDEEAARAFDVHLADSPDCRAEADAVRTIIDVGRAEDREPPAAIVTALQAAARRSIAAHHGSSSGGRPVAFVAPPERSRNAPIWAAAAALILAGGVAAWFWVARPVDEGMSISRLGPSESPSPPKRMGADEPTVALDAADDLATESARAGERERPPDLAASRARKSVASPASPVGDFPGSSAPVPSAIAAEQIEADGIASAQGSLGFGDESGEALEPHAVIADLRRGDHEGALRVLTGDISEREARRGERSLRRGPTQSLAVSAGTDAAGREPHLGPELIGQLRVLAGSDDDSARAALLAFLELAAPSLSDAEAVAALTMAVQVARDLDRPDSAVRALERLERLDRPAALNLRE